MASIYTVKAGSWSDSSVWNTGTVPTEDDDVTIMHAITIDGNASAGILTIDTGGSLTTDTNPLTTSYTMKATYINMARTLNDTRVVRLDGMTLSITSPSITSIGNGDGLPITQGVTETPEAVIFDDPGVPGYSAQMKDITPEGGCVRAYARKVSNGVRYLSITVRIRSNNGAMMGQLYRMAELPYQVLAVTYSSIIKGHIEAITPVESTGKEYRTFRVSIAEGA